MSEKRDNNRVSGHKDVAQNVAHPVPDMPYLLKRVNKYSFNRRAPFPLKPGAVLYLDDKTPTVGKNGFIRFPLGTSNKKLAATLARKYAHLVDVAVDRLINVRAESAIAIPKADLLPPTPEEIRGAALAMRADLLAADEATAEASVAQVLAGDIDVREPDRYLLKSESLPPLSAFGQAELLQKLGRMACWYLYQTSGKTINSIGPELLPFADTFRQLVGDLSKRANGEIVPTPPRPMQSALGCTWPQALDYYFKQRVTAPKTREIYSTAWGDLEQHAKCVPANLHPDQIVSFRDKLIQKHQARTTAKHRLGICAAIWRECRAAGLIARETLDPFDYVIVRIPRGQSTSRTQFSEDELRAIFTADPPSTRDSVSIHAGYWIPLIAAYYGARLEEITGIEVEDLLDTPTGISFWIRPNSTRSLKGKDSSARCLPLHPVILSLGFDTYCRTAQEAGVKLLFPSLASSRTFGEEFVTFCKKLLKPIAGRKVGLHCLRHNWETARRNAEPYIDGSIGQYIGGRAIEKGSAGAYGAPAGQVKILNELSKIEHGLKHREAPRVTAEMLCDQEKQRMASLKAGKQRAETRRKNLELKSK